MENGTDNFFNFKTEWRDIQEIELMQSISKAVYHYNFFFEIKWLSVYETAFTKKCINNKDMRHCFILWRYDAEILSDKK